MKLNFLRKMTRNEKAACLVCAILFLLFISASVLAAFLFGMLNRSENNFSDYRKKTDIELSDHEKAGMDAKKDLAAMRNSLELAEKNREQLEGRIAGLETEIKNLENGFGDADGLYASLNSRLEELKKQLSEKEAEISGLKNQIVSFGKSYNIDLNSQAELLNREGTQFNVCLGLCVGHDSLFYKYSKALVTTLVAKDRVTGNNPVAAIYCADGYLKNRLELEGPPEQSKP